MKIFITEYEQKGVKYSGVNIYADSEENAEKIADRNNLTIIGEILEIKFKPEIEEEMALLLIEEDEKTLH
jgi:hypothetical protein|tara:strand:+ start:551 stop:760 length:210 start_codon:yes stop_codon:yes gene_type:complete